MWGGRCVDLYEKEKEETKNKIVKSVTSKDLVNIQVYKESRKFYNKKVLLLRKSKFVWS